MTRVLEMKRFTVALDDADYTALRALAQRQKPTVNLQYMVRLAVRDLLEHHGESQLPLKLTAS